MGKDYHIFIVVAGDCGACEQFHRLHYKQIESAVGSDKISIVEFDNRSLLVNPEYVKRFQAVRKPDLHPQCVNVRWTPTIAVVTKESWDDKSVPLEGSVYGGTMSVKNDQNVFVRTNNAKLNMDAASIIQWIQKQIEENPSFKHYRDISVSQSSTPQMEMFGHNITFRGRNVLQ